MADTINLADYVAATGNEVRMVGSTIRRLARAAPPGTVIDARNLGTALLESDPFDGIATANLELVTGEGVLHLDFNRNFITLPSRLTWRMEGTQIRPVRPITTIASDASPAAGMIATAISGGYCTVGEGRDILTVDDSSGLHVGARIAVLGTKVDPSVSFRLARRIVAGQRGILPLVGDVETTISNSRVYLIIGNETLLVTVESGQVVILERGALGSQSIDHPDGSPVVLARSTIATIADVRGKLVRLEAPMHRPAVRTIFKAGAVDVSLVGQGLIDGGYTGGPGGIYSVVASTLSTRFNCSGELQIARASHGGLFLFGATLANVQLASISEVGRRSEKLGASIWLFGETDTSSVTVSKVDKGNLGIAIDNKSFGVSYVGVDGPGRDNHVEVGALVEHLTGIQITAGQSNQCHLGLLESESMDVIIDPDARQSTQPISAQNNIVVIERQKQRRPDSVESGNQVVRY
jgi:hypothetical protein